MPLGAAVERRKRSSEPPALRRAHCGRLCGLGLAALLLAGCEAPLLLDGVQAEQAKPALRFDSFQALAANDARTVAVSSAGGILVSEDGARNWRRHRAAGAPAWIDVAACPNGAFFALATARQVWRLASGQDDWTPLPLDTAEEVLSLHCDPANALWVGGSFATLLVSRDAGASWREQSLGDDLQITAIDFVDAQAGFAFGEFGTALTTMDGGETWSRAADIPNEFYPMAADFRSRAEGWVGGLDGVIWRTADGGQTWLREQTLSDAPIYGMLATAEQVLAVGEGGTILARGAEGWAPVPGLPSVLTWLRGLAALPDGGFLAAGGGGALLRVPLDALPQAITEGAAS